MENIIDLAALRDLAIVFILLFASMTIMYVIWDALGWWDNEK